MRLGITIATLIALGLIWSAAAHPHALPRGEKDWSRKGIRMSGA